MTALGELRALGLDAHLDSMGLTVTGPDEAFVHPGVAVLRSRRGELIDDLLDEMRLRFPAPPAAPPSTTLCLDCGTPCGSALRCAACATARVPRRAEAAS